MNAMTTTLRRMGAAALFSMAVAAPAAAQTMTRNPAADALSQEATALYSTPLRFREAAEMHTRAADMRSLDDPRRVGDLIMAGRLFVYSGDVEAGRRSMEQAAQTALVAGDLSEAGNIYVDAAFVALQGGNGSEARRLLRAAKWVASAPALSAGEARQINRRMAGDAEN